MSPVLQSLSRPRYRHALVAGGEVIAKALARRCLGVVTVSPVQWTKARPRPTGPQGPFDLVVLQDALHAFSKVELRRALDRCWSTLTAGGELIAVHRRGPPREGQLPGDAVHDLLARHLPGRRVSVDQLEGDYLLGIWERA